MESKIKNGDIVRLKSGGPDMTIVNQEPFVPTLHYCAWFDNNGINLSASFWEHTLESVKENGRIGF